MLCEIGGEVRQNSLRLVKLVVTELLGDQNELAKELTHYWTEAI
jgi:hypothetical protein